MSDDNEFKIIEEILEKAIAVASPGWREMILNYYVQENRSGCVNTFLIEEDGLLKKKSLPDPDIDSDLKRLRSFLMGPGRMPFSRCKIHLADGKYEVIYGYGELDWKALLTSDWNFFPKRKA